MRDVILYILAFVAVAAFAYAMFWIAKNGSYFFFYEDMVQQTIREMVKPEYLN